MMNSLKRSTEIVPSNEKKASDFPKKQFFRTNLTQAFEKTLEKCTLFSVLP